MSSLRAQSEPGEAELEIQAVQRPSILVVDDSRLQRKILGSSLQKWGFRLYQAESGERALDICQSNHIDMIISDWMMPGMNGPEFCRAFRALRRDTYGYFILLTSKSAKEEVAQGLEAGADDFLTKPVHPDELRARIIAGQRIQKMERELHNKNQIVSETLSKLQTLYDRIDRDLIEARKLQQSLIKERYRDYGGASVALALQTSGHVGGDLVGMFPINDHQIGIYGIDVSGHGIASALMTVRLAGHFPAEKPEQNIALSLDGNGQWRPRPPSDVARDLNRLVLQEIDTEQYFTLALGHLDLQTGRLVMTQCGHPHPIIMRAQGQIEQVGMGGLPVGLIDGAEFECLETTLLPGDRALLVSDGITECTAPNGKMIEPSELERLLRRASGTSGEAFCNALIEELAKFSGRSGFEDDVSIVSVEFTGAWTDSCDKTLP